MFSEDGRVYAYWDKKCIVVDKRDEYDFKRNKTLWRSTKETHYRLKLIHVTKNKVLDQLARDWASSGVCDAEKCVGYRIASSISGNYYALQVSGVFTVRERNTRKIRCVVEMEDKGDMNCIDFGFIGDDKLWALIRLSDLTRALAVRTCNLLETPTKFEKLCSLDPYLMRCPVMDVAVNDEYIACLALDGSDVRLVAFRYEKPPSSSRRAKISNLLWTTYERPKEEANGWDLSKRTDIFCLGFFKQHYFAFFLDNLAIFDMRASLFTVLHRNFGNDCFVRDISPDLSVASLQQRTGESVSLVHLVDYSFLLSLFLSFRFLPPYVLLLIFDWSHALEIAGEAGRPEVLIWVAERFQHKQKIDFLVRLQNCIRSK